MIDHFYYTADQGICKEVCAKKLIVGCQAPEPVQTAVMCGLGYALRYAKQRRECFLKQNSAPSLSGITSS